MAITRQTIIHTGPGGTFEAMLIADDVNDVLRPGVMLIPNILGTKDSDFARAEALAEQGYAVLVADLYGQGKRTRRGDPDMGRYMDELNADRTLLRDRLATSLDVLRAQAMVDNRRLGAIGYCFGGKCVLDMARHGLPILGGVSFHGVYDPLPGHPQASIGARLLICHGWDDNLGPPDAVVALARELTDAGADWELNAYGHTGHAFTDHSVPQQQPGGFGWRADADARSWAAMTRFFAGLFAAT